MPGYRKTRTLSKQQKEFLATKKISEHSEKRLGLLRPRRQNIAQQLSDYLVNYNAGLINIDIKYPFGHKDRPEWLEVHRKNGVKRILQILSDKVEEV